MTKTSEYCAVGHPDRMCDYIVSFILDRFLENDPMARVALECQLKDNHATLSGEVTSTASFSDEDLKRFVRAAIHDIGYTKKYQSLFGAEHTIAADDVEVLERPPLAASVKAIHHPREKIAKTEQRPPRQRRNDGQRQADADPLDRYQQSIADFLLATRHTDVLYQRPRRRAIRLRFRLFIQSCNHVPKGSFGGVWPTAFMAE